MKILKMIFQVMKMKNKKFPPEENEIIDVDPASEYESQGDENDQS